MYKFNRLRQKMARTSSLTGAFSRTSRIGGRSILYVRKSVRASIPGSIFVTFPYVFAVVSMPRERLLRRKQCTYWHHASHCLPRPRLVSRLALEAHPRRQPRARPDCFDKFPKLYLESKPSLRIEIQYRIVNRHLERTISGALAVWRWCCCQTRQERLGKTPQPSQCQVEVVEEQTLAVYLHHIYMK